MTRLYIQKSQGVWKWDEEFRNGNDLQWKAFDLLNKDKVNFMGGGAAGRRHLGFYQELEIRLKPREMMIFFVHDLKNKT